MRAGRTFLIALVLWSSPAGAAGQDQAPDDAVRPDPVPTEPIRYITPDVPEIEGLEYRGERYEALVPDTFDLAERAALAIHAMTEGLSPACDHEAFWHSDLLDIPERMDHNYSDDVRIKYFQALPYLRLMSGSAQHLDREREVLKLHLKMQGPDGLIYTPLRGRPWGIPDGRWGEYPDPPGGWGDQVADLTWANGRMLGAFSVYARLFPGGPWRRGPAGRGPGGPDRHPEVPHLRADRPDRDQPPPLHHRAPGERRGLDRPAGQGAALLPARPLPRRPDPLPLDDAVRSRGRAELVGAPPEDQAS